MTTICDVVCSIYLDLEARYITSMYPKSFYRLATFEVIARVKHSTCLGENC